MSLFLPLRIRGINILSKFICLCFLGMVFACSNHLGYGVLLWSNTDSEIMKGLSNGQVLTIKGKSKVHNHYLVSVKNTQRPIATSRIAFFRHLSNAQAYREQFLKYRDWYAINMKHDGLIMRSAPKIRAEQVYRLRPRQKIKVLDLVSARVTLGDIEGRWYEVLTEDGVRGFVFDYYLRVEDRSKPIEKQVIKLGATEESPDKLDINLNSLEGIWYKSTHAEQLRNSKNIDLRLLMLPYGQLYLNQKRNRLFLYLERSSKASQILVYNPQDIVVDSSVAELNFGNDKIRIIFIKADEISLYFRNNGKVKTVWEFQKIGKAELRGYQQQALIKRKVALASIFQNGSQFSATQLYGTIRFQPDGKFVWSNTQALVDIGILKSPQKKGTLFFSYQLGGRLRERYEQLITFVFEDLQELTFLLRTNHGRVFLRYVPPGRIDKEGILNSDAFNEKLEIEMQQEGRAILPIDLF